LKIHRKLTSGYLLGDKATLIYGRESLVHENWKKRAQLGEQVCHCLSLLNIHGKEDIKMNAADSSCRKKRRLADSSSSSVITS
jgi:hypothetical protein